MKFLLKHPIWTGFFAGVLVWVVLSVLGFRHTISQVKPTGPLGVQTWSSAERKAPRQFVLLLRDDGEDRLVRLRELRQHGATAGAERNAFELPDRYDPPSATIANKVNDSSLELRVDLLVGSSDMSAYLLSSTRASVGSGVERQVITLFDDMGNEWSYVYTQAGGAVTLEESWASYEPIAGMFAVIHGVILSAIAGVVGLVSWITVTGLLFLVRWIGRARSGRRVPGAAPEGLSEEGQLAAEKSDPIP